MRVCHVPGSVLSNLHNLCKAMSTEQQSMSTEQQQKKLQLIEGLSNNCTCLPDNEFKSWNLNPSNPPPDPSGTTLHKHVIL